MASVVQSGGPTLSFELTGEAISFLRVYLVRKNRRPLQSLYDIVKQVPDSKCRPEIKKYFRSSVDTLRNFVENNPRYFKIENDVVSLLPCKSRGEIETILRIPRPAKGDCRAENICIVTNPKFSAQVVCTLLGESVIAVDCEGECLGITGKLTLVQVATIRGDVYLFDVLACKDKYELFIQGRLKELLEDTNVVKVMHACRSDSAALYHQFGVSLQNVFDTECAYHVLLDQYNVDKKQCNPGLNHICTLFGGPVNEVNEDIKYRMTYDHSYWSYRPMSKWMVTYAAADVFALLPDVYYNMKKALNPGWTSKLHQLCQENVDWHFTRE
ncbi:piRNA biogenesis protein EXD1-like [Glandiceps talaboti]